MNNFRRPLIVATSSVLCVCCLVLLHHGSVGHVKLESQLSIQEVFTQLDQQQMKKIFTLWGCETVYIGPAVHTDQKKKL